MKAKFDSACSACNGLIKKGKEIVKNSSGRWVHKHCAAEQIELP